MTATDEQKTPSMTLYPKEPHNDRTGAEWINKKLYRVQLKELVKAITGMLLVSILSFFLLILYIRLFIRLSIYQLPTCSI